MAESMIDQAGLEAARLLLERMGISPLDLVAGASARPAAPTFAEYVPVVAASISAGLLRAYGTYWDRVVERWGARPIDQVSPSDIRALIVDIKANRVQRRNGRGGRSAEEHTIAALRCLYRRATADGFMSESDNPALKVPKPKRLPSTRRALPDGRLAEINEVATTSGDDPALDGLLIRLHGETACRRGGALALRPMDLDADQCLILLREKGGAFRWQPVSPTLMTHLQAHAAERGAPPSGQLLRYRNRQPITRRRYDHLWERIGARLPWVAAQQISAHWLRHTTLTWVERNFGYAVARAYAGHAENTGGDVGATAGYVRASMTELADAVSALTNEPHPLASVRG
ncbi:tyrosine-type recombinase/integrase [Paractinoplanes globisporus]|uniref:Tyrosine-type recombinase/integrase n=1 Tax=Paractinoplanes globisporus TaxID=113565 RepID=A0ABW6WFK2_9ACTN|nr:site-specific integrase [Actinoplanes globisporus]